MFLNWWDTSQMFHRKQGLIAMVFLGLISCNVQYLFLNFNSLLQLMQDYGNWALLIVGSVNEDFKLRMWWIFKFFAALNIGCTYSKDLNNIFVAEQQLSKKINTGQRVIKNCDTETPCAYLIFEWPSPALLSLFWDAVFFL